MRNKVGGLFIALMLAMAAAFGAAAQATQLKSARFAPMPGADSGFQAQIDFQESELCSDQNIGLNVFPAGVTPALSVDFTASKTPIPLLAITRGEYDGCIAKIRAAAATVAPRAVYVDLAPEANDASSRNYPPDAQTGGAANLKAAIRYVAQRLRTQSNIRVIQSLNESGDGLNLIDVYAGDDLVDMPGYHIFEWGTSRKWSHARSGAEILAKAKSDMAPVTRKSFMITKFAVNQLDNQAQVLTDLLGGATNDPDIAGVGIFEGGDNGSEWHLSGAARQVAANFFGVPKPEILAGDANGDGMIDIKDATLILKAAVGLTPGNAAFDANGDGIIDIRDVTLVLKMAVGL